jgi:hypothetical protein
MGMSFQEHLHVHGLDGVKLGHPDSLQVEHLRNRHCCLVVLAFGVRFQMFWITGGAYEDYQTWSDAHYFGGISNIYLIGADLIASFIPYNITSYPPGYSIILAALSVFTDDNQTLRLYQAALDSCTVLPLYHVGRRLAGPAAGLLAGAVYAASPLFAFNAVTLLAESLSPLLVASILALMLWARDGTWPRWAILGAVAGLASLIRPDLLLFAGPLGMWWLFTNRRIRPLTALAVAFIIPLLSWGFYSQAVVGQFIVTSNSGMYAFWAGLGQVPNDYGYFVSDARAGELLAERGIKWHSPEANAYWKAEYLKAWHDHPEHVLATIWYRLSSMPFVARSYFGPYEYGSWLHDYFEHCGVFVLILSCVLLIWRKRYAAAFIVALPLLYALASLGPIYYEHRYVRYLALSYVLAPLVAIYLIQSRWLRLGAIGVLGGVFTTGMLTGTPALIWHATASRVLVAAEQEHGTVVETIRSLTWTPAVPDVSFSAVDEGLALTTSAQGSAYQIMARQPLPPGMLALRYAAEVREGTIAIGILSPDMSRWLALRAVGGSAPESGSLSAPLPDGGILMITNSRGEDLPSEATIRTLDVLTFP